jgi:phosphate-selective porin OprO/OprP
MVFVYSRTLIVLLMLLITDVGVRAQETTDAPSDQTKEQTKAKEVEAASDLRDSIHENLETLSEDAETADGLRKETASDIPDEQQQENSAGTSTSPIDESDEPPAEDKSILGFFKSIPGYLQSVPDRVPFIRDRGLIFFGRTEIDYAHYSSGITKSDVKAEIDLTDGDSNFADLYVRYRHKKYGLFTAGNQRVAQTLVNQTSRISRTFMEEPLPAEAFGLGRRLALGWDLNKPKSGVHMTLFGPDLNGSIGDSGYAGRVYFNPTRSHFALFHVGASYVLENMSRKTRFFSHPESRVTEERLVDTGIFEDVDRQEIVALEVAGSRDSMMFRAEFFRAKWDRNTAKDPVFKGFYAQAARVWTGETYKYTQGKFLRIRPQNPRGAWETAVRFSRINLNDKGIFGGEERNLTFAVNWYAPGNQLRIMSNLIFVRTDVPRTDGKDGNESPTIFQLRAQFHW